MCDVRTVWSAQGQIERLQKHPSGRATCATVAHCGAPTVSLSESVGVSVSESVSVSVSVCDCLRECEKESESEVV